MIVNLVRKSFRPLWVALLSVLLSAAPSSALLVRFTTGGDADKLNISFDTSPAPKYSVKRTGKRQVTISFPKNIWNTERKPSISKFNGGRLVDSMTVQGDSLVLNMKTDALGFINVPGDANDFLLQVYRDPIGSRWQPPQPKPAAKPKPATKAEPPIQAAPKPAAQPAANAKGTVEPPVQAPAPKDNLQSAEAVRAALDQGGAKSVAQPAQPQPVQPQPVPVQAPSVPAPAVASADNGQGGKPFYSVPNTVRSTVAPPPEVGQPGQVLEGAPDLNAVAGNAPVAAPVASSSGSVGGVVATPPGAEAPNVAGGVVQAPVQPAPANEAGGSVPAPPVDGNVAAGAVQPPPGVESEPNVVGVVAAPVAEGQGGPEPMLVSQPAEQGGNQVGGAVAPPPGAVGGVVAPPPVVEANPAAAPVVANAQPDGPSAAGAVQPPPDAPVAGAVESVVAPPPVVAQGESAPPVVDEKPVDDAQPAALPNAQAAAEAAMQGDKPAEVPVEGAAPIIAGVEATPEQLREVGGNATKLEQLLESYKNKMFDGQSQMYNGNLAGAKSTFEFLLKQALLPQQMREELLYALADINRQLFKDNPVEHFDEIAGTYQEALNANLESESVPRALLNLGLINLQVGNIPEAKAYFSILQSKYPDDQSIPAISFYWGEYYFKKGDYQKAADQLQHMIQAYPEHELVKDASYYLAESLERLGYDRQAFQIVDYIDKRWPDFYMARPHYLLLSAGVLEKVEKFTEAKDAYFTYYNLNPEADRSDFALAKIGDMYLRQGEKKAAKEIYQRTIKLFPDKEGGLVARMRMAEEGIYDDPTIAQMDKVFDRPYNLRPVKIYEEIVSKYPESPLAPVAQLKLAMWYTFHNKYPEALAAAQDFVDKFPKSKLLPRARELGDKVFVLAVPQLVEEENYGRVVQFWENYDFIGEGDTKVDDRTKLMVAQSYWKVGMPDKALAILAAYLDGPQIPNISNKALGLAVSIYLDEFNWDKIDEVVLRAQRNGWKLEDNQERQLEYARAMSLQNLGKSLDALPLWAKLATDKKNPPDFRGYAMYYMAKNAMKNQDLRKVFAYSQEALALLLQSDGDVDKIKDAVLMSIYATERSGRYQEALKWARQYDKYISVDNPEWAPTRYKLAQIYRKAGAMREWERLMKDIIEKKPDSLQAELAKSALEASALEKRAQEYAPAP